MSKKFVVVAKPKSNIERIDKNKSAILKVDLGSLAPEQTPDRGREHKPKSRTEKKR